MFAHLPWKHQHPPTQLRATVNAKPAGTVKAANSPQLLSPSLNCTLMKFSIQKGSQTQRLVNESQWPWSEQFNWHAASSRRGAQGHRSQCRRRTTFQGPRGRDGTPRPTPTGTCPPGLPPRAFTAGTTPVIPIMAEYNWSSQRGPRLFSLAVFRISSSYLTFHVPQTFFSGQLNCQDRRHSIIEEGNYTKHVF